MVKQVVRQIASPDTTSTVDRQTKVHHSEQTKQSVVAPKMQGGNL